MYIRTNAYISRWSALTSACSAQDILTVRHQIYLNSLFPSTSFMRFFTTRYAHRRQVQDIPELRDF